jgi:hypothetical protein
VPTTVSVEIDRPASAGNVSGGGAFVSWGRYSVNPSMSVTVSGWIADSGGAIVTYGTTSFPPSGENWSYKFSGLNINVPYVENIQVTAADGTIGSATLDITCVSP